ncbi:MAG: TIGR01777 family oxidoreductase [Pirellulales bacterium]
MHIAVTGASGLVGSTLVPLLTASGHRVTRVVRGEADVDAVSWDPAAASWDAAPVAGIDGLVHLAGENIAATRWNETAKGRIRASRVHGTRILCEAVARLPAPPKVLVSASAIGFYGHRGDELLDETSAPGQGFLAEVVQQWEAAIQAAADAGIRVVQLRFGVILSPRGGALVKMLLPFKLGVGGRVGSGRQWWSWISVEDAAGAIQHGLMTDTLRGAVNAAAPNPVTNAEFTKTLGRLLQRPTLLPMPAFAARLALGEMADELLLASTRVAVNKLIGSGYAFRHPTLDEALRHLLGASV